jgi:hypothetical protein
MAAVTLVQNVAVIEGTGTSRTGTLPGPSTTGNTLIVAVGLYSSDGGSNEIDLATTNPVVDGTNTFTPIAAAEIKRSATTYYQHQYFYIATHITGLTTETVTATFQRSTFNFLTVWELTPSQFDQATTNTAASTAVNAGTLTPSANGAFALLLAEIESSTTVTPSSGWTSDRNAQAGNGTTYHGHQPQTTAAAINFTVTAAGTGTHEWSATGITLTPPGPAPVTLTPGGVTHSRGQGSISVSIPSGVARQLGSLSVATFGRPRPIGQIHARGLGNPGVTGRELQPTGQTHVRQQGNPTLSARVLPPGQAHARGQAPPAVNPITPDGLVRSSGSLTPSGTLYPSASLYPGIGIGRALGLPTVTSVAILRLTGQAHPRALGAPSSHGLTTLTPRGLAHNRTQGTPILSARSLPAGLAHARTLGQPAVNVRVLALTAISRT